MTNYSEKQFNINNFMYLALISQKIWELMVVLVSRNAILAIKDNIFSMQLKHSNLFIFTRIYKIVWCILSIRPAGVMFGQWPIRWMRFETRTMGCSSRGTQCTRAGSWDRNQLELGTRTQVGYLSLGGERLGLVLHLV